MKKAVKYRLEFPYTTSYIEHSGQINQGLEKVNQAVNRMIEKYK